MPITNRVRLPTGSSGRGGVVQVSYSGKLKRQIFHGEVHEATGSSLIGTIQFNMSFAKTCRYEDYKESYMRWMTILET